MTATLTPTENQVFDAIWGFVAGLFDPTVQPSIFKGFQNLTATPTGSYIVIQPGIVQRMNQIARSYDPVGLVANNSRSTVYSYQVDCYGPSGPDWSNIIAIAWRTLWACDYFAGNLATPTPGAPLPVTPLYADEPQQLNVVNGELQYEQRFMLKLYADVTQVVALPQDFFGGPVPIVLKVPSDDTPV